MGQLLHGPPSQLEFVRWHTSAEWRAVDTATPAGEFRSGMSRAVGSERLSWMSVGLGISSATTGSPAFLHQTSMARQLIRNSGLCFFELVITHWGGVVSEIKGDLTSILGSHLFQHVSTASFGIQHLGPWAPNDNVPRVFGRSFCRLDVFPIRLELDTRAFVCLTTLFGFSELAMVAGVFLTLKK